MRRIPAALLGAVLLAGCTAPFHPWVEGGGWYPSASGGASDSSGYPVPGPGGAGPGFTVRTGTLGALPIPDTEVAGLVGGEMGWIDARAGGGADSSRAWSFDALASAGFALAPKDAGRTLASAEILGGFGVTSLDAEGGFDDSWDERLLGVRLTAGPVPGVEVRFEYLAGEEDTSGQAYQEIPDRSTARWFLGLRFPLGGTVAVDVGWRSLSIEGEDDGFDTDYEAAGPWVGVALRF